MNWKMFESESYRVGISDTTKDKYAEQVKLVKNVDMIKAYIDHTTGVVSLPCSELAGFLEMPIGDLIALLNTTCPDYRMVKEDVPGRYGTLGIIKGAEDEI